MRKYAKGGDIKFIYVPYLKNLTMDKILEFAEKSVMLQSIYRKPKARLVLEIANGFATLVRTNL